jgi:hypothetical protein
MPGARLTCVFAAVVLLTLSAGRPARADTVLLSNGDYVIGEIQLTEVRLLTEGKVVRVVPRDAAALRLGAMTGDVLHLRTGRTVTGWVEDHAYTVRLPSGQSVLIERRRVHQLYFSPR